MEYKQIFAIQNTNKKRIKTVCSDAKDESGIYIFSREENGIKYAYVGQSKKVLSRLADHLKGYQHIDLSIKKHGLKSEKNSNGWDIHCFYCGEYLLDKKERKYIVYCANQGYQLYNHTTGGQDDRKRVVKEQNRKGYIEGLHNGYEKARKEVAHWFDLHLKYDVKRKGNKNQEKAKTKFEKFINVGDD